MAHLEDLLAEYLDWQGYIVKQNILVDKRDKGGWNGELDIVAYHPTDPLLLHMEPSLDTHSWAKREERFKKKFDAGRRWIFEEVFPWLKATDIPKLQQIAILPSRGSRKKLAGGRLITVDECIAIIRKDIYDRMAILRGTIPEKYPLLRIMQFLVHGYKKVVDVPEHLSKLS